MGMWSGCDVMRNSFSVRLQMAGKANRHPEQSWAVGARDDGDSGWCGGAFPDLSALLSCCGHVRFAGFGATLDGSMPLVSILSHLLPVSVLNPKGLEGDLQGVFEALLLSSLGSICLLKVPRTKFSFVVGGLPCEPHAQPSGAGTASEWCRCWGGLHG